MFNLFMIVIPSVPENTGIDGHNRRFMYREGP